MPDKQLDAMEAALDKVVRAVDAKILSLIAKLNTDSEGFLISDQINLERATAMRAEIAAEFAPYYQTVREQTSNYSTVGARIKRDFKKAGIAMSFTDVDADIVRAFADDTFASLVALGEKTAADVGAMVYSNVVAGGSIEDTIASVSQLLVGKQDKRGQPMVNHSKTITTTKYMEIDAIMTKRKGDEFGIDKYRYDGSLIKDSRQWCVDHQGGEFTLDEIEAWGGQDWQGKSPGDPFVARGGWNCRHSFTPVVD